MNSLCALESSILTGERVGWTVAVLLLKIRWRKVRAPLGRVPGNAWEA